MVYSKRVFVRDNLLHSVLCKGPDIDFSIQNYSKITSDMIR